MDDRYAKYIDSNEIKCEMCLNTSKTSKIIEYNGKNIYMYGVLLFVKISKRF